MAEQIPAHWARMAGLLAAAKKDEAVMDKLKSGDKAKFGPVLETYGITPDVIDKCRADLDPFVQPDAYGKWFYLEAKY